MVDVRWLGDHRLFLRFEDGSEGEVDLSDLEFNNLFADLRDPEYFSRVFVNPEAGTIAWPNGVELDPVVLYEDITSGARP